MGKHEHKLIFDFLTRAITKDEFLRLYPAVIDSGYVLNVLEETYAEKSADGVEYYLNLIIFLKPPFNAFVNLLCKLLQEDWHRRHEDIVQLLQGIKSPDSIDTIYAIALRKFDYLDYDDTYALARKCIHALGDINTDYSKEKLRLLAAAGIPILKEKAEKQLYYYKR